MKVSKLSSSFLSLILVSFLVLGFKKQNKLQLPIKKSLIDSITTSYEISENKKIKIATRLQQINLSYELSKLNNIDSLALKALAKKTSIFGEIKAYDRAIYYTQVLKKYALQLKDTHYLAISFNKLGLYYFKSNQPIKSFKNYNESKKYYISLNDSSQVGRKALNLAIIQKNLSDYLGSEKTAIMALRYLKPIKDKKYIASAYNVLATNSKAQNNYTESIYWYNKAIKETKNSSDAFFYKNNLALVYVSLKEYNKAINLLSDLSKNYLKENKKEDARISDNLTYTRWLKNNLYDPTNSLTHNLNIHLRENDVQGSISSYMHLAKYNLDKNLNKATAYTIKALEASEKIKSIKGKLESLRLLIEIKPNEGYQSYVEEYLYISDSVNNARLKAKNQFAKIKYDTEKTRDVNLVLNAKIAEDSLRIAKETYRRNLGILISSLLIISVGFIIHNWRQRIKIASFNATTNTENRISKKVHDEMANDISNIKTLVKNQIPTTIPVKKQLINMLDIAYLSARDIASETGDVIFSESFGKDLKNLLMQHNNDNIKIITNLSALNQLKIDKHKKVALYRTLQELMVNMNKHSKATRVVIAHRKEGKYNEIKYTDNGVGTDSVKKNNGLDNAASRMNDIRGSFSFETSKGNGFKALLKFKV